MPAIATLDDQTLVRRAVEGEAECFTVLVHRHLGPLKNHVRSMLRDATEVDDLLQQVLLKTWLNLAAFRFESSFRAWATRIATNEVLQSFRSQKRRGMCQPPHDFQYIPSPAESPLQRAARLEREQAVRRAILRLPARYRQILFLRYVQERNERETARCLHSSIAAVKTRSFRARQMLRALLERMRFDVPDRSNRSVQKALRP
jgi:RNA polymerase sigma-70 factor (ECF subfamily)